MAFYLRCRRCDGTGLDGPEDCPACKGYGGFWVLTGTKGGGLWTKIVPGDADEKPEEPP